MLKAEAIVASVVKLTGPSSTDIDDDTAMIHASRRRARDHWPSRPSKPRSALVALRCSSRASMSRVCGAWRGRPRPPGSRPRCPLLRDGARQRRALGPPAARAARRGCPYGFLTQSFLVATFFNNFLPEQHRRRRRPHHRHGEGRGIEDAGDDGGADRSRDRPAGAGADGGHRRRRCMHRMAVGPVGPGVLWAGFGLGAVIATPALLMPEIGLEAAPAAPRVPPGMGRRADRKAHLHADAIQGDARRAGRVLRRGGRGPGDPGRVLRGDRAQHEHPDRVRRARGDRPGAPSSSRWCRCR